MQNAYYEFYDELDLDFNDRTLLSETADKEIVNKYRLFSVIVRSERSHGWHYSVFIKSNSKWYNFDDGIVNEASEIQAITAQFGQTTFFR